MTLWPSKHLPQEDPNQASLTDNQKIRYFIAIKLMTQQAEVSVEEYALGDIWTIFIRLAYFTQDSIWLLWTGLRGKTQSVNDGKYHRKAITIQRRCGSTLPPWKLGGSSGKGQDFSHVADYADLLLCCISMVLIKNLESEHLLNADISLLF